MALEPLSTDYKKNKKTLANAKYDTPLTDIMKNLSTMLGEAGPEQTHYAQLDHMRTVTFKFKEVERILESVGIGKDSRAMPSEEAIKRLAAVKFLRHLHLVGYRGGQKVWVLSTPKSYRHYPHAELTSVKSSMQQVKTRLEDKTEEFSTEVKAKLSEATQLGLAWCEAAKTVLSSANSNEKSMEKVKRWFAASDTSETDIAAVIAKLQDGFKKIANTLNLNQVMITDMPSLRDDANYNLTEAFVLSMSNKAEMPRTIYIEKALMENYDISVLHDMRKNWTRVLVHEATHIDARTDDKRYAYRGIKPGTHLTTADAAVNADSWAFFAADCGGALVENEIARALGGTGGTLTKLDENWNR